MIQFDVYPGIRWLWVNQQLRRVHQFTLVTFWGVEPWAVEDYLLCREPV